MCEIKVRFFSGRSIRRKVIAGSDSFAKFMELADAEMVLRLYGLEPDADHAACRIFLRTLAGDCSFGIPQRRILQASSLPETYGYHFDLVNQQIATNISTCAKCIPSPRKSKVPSTAFHSMP